MTLSRHLHALDQKLENLAALSLPRQLTFLALCALILFLPGFFTLPPFDRDESRYAQASYQMQQTADVIDIRLQDEPRYKKPVGIYWLQAGTASVASWWEAEKQIWIYRLPSLAGAILAVLLTTLIAQQFMSTGPSLLAGVLMASTILLGVEARMAKTDAVLLASILTMQWMLARLYTGTSGRAGGMPYRPLSLPGALLFWLALAVSVLVKGPIGLMVVGGTIILLCLFARRTRWLLALRPLTGLALTLALILPWYIAITIQSDGGFWAASLGKDLLGKVATGQESHGAPPGSFLAVFPLTAWPMSIIFLLMLPALWRNRRRPMVMFMAAWLLPTWLIFELVTTKLPHYVLPVYPALAIAAAWAWHTNRHQGRLSIFTMLLVALFLLLPLILIAAAGGISLYLEGTLPIQVILAGALAVLAAFLAWHALRYRFAYASVMALFAGSFALGAGVYPTLAQVGYIWPSHQAAAYYHQFQGCSNPDLLTATYIEPSFVFGTDTRLQRHNGTTIAKALSSTTCALAFINAEEYPKFRQAIEASPVPPRKMGEVKGFNFGGGDPIHLHIYVITPQEK